MYTRFFKQIAAFTSLYCDLDLNISARSIDGLLQLSVRIAKTLTILVRKGTLPRNGGSCAKP